MAAVVSGLTKVFCLVAEYELYCELIVQRPVRRPTAQLPSRMTDEELAHMADLTKNHFDAIMAVLQKIPRQMLLFIRYVGNLS